MAVRELHSHLPESEIKSKVKNSTKQHRLLVKKVHYKIHTVQAIINDVSCKGGMDGVEAAGCLKKTVYLVFSLNMSCITDKKKT
jgi:hypothetical protein